MQSDPLFYRFFKDLPGTFFQLIDRPEEDAQLYEMKAIEYKSTSVRLDGVFSPRQPAAGPAYLWEAQFYLSNSFYANLLTKIGRFLEHGDPAQEWKAVVIYPSRSLEQKNLSPYRCLLDSDQLIRIYLDELPAAKPDQFEMGILELIAARPEGALQKAKAMVPRVLASKRPAQFRRLLLQFIETVIVHQFPKWSRKDVEKMLQVTDFRQTRVYQEAREEERDSIALRMLEAGRPVAEISQMTGLSQVQVRKLAKKSKE